MNIILIPGAARSGRQICLSHRQLLVILLVGVVLLPAVLGIVSFRIHDMLRRHSGGEDQFELYAKELMHQARSIETAKLDASANLDTLTRRMGQIQAQLLRLNALGGRLTRMASLDDHEFSFETEVAQGGPETNTDAG